MAKGTGHVVCKERENKTMNQSVKKKHLSAELPVELPSKLQRLLVFLLYCIFGILPNLAAAAPVPATHSSTITLTKSGKILLVVNRDMHSLSIMDAGGRNASTPRKIAEVSVGMEPRCVAADPKGIFAYVTNAISGTVSVIKLKGKNNFNVQMEIPVGTEPRGCALTPNGKRLFVANYTQGTISVINTASNSVIGVVKTGGHPAAIAITSDGDKDDFDETVFVTEFYSELIPGKAQPFDDARRGVVHAFPSGSLGPVSKILLSPLPNSGFAADRSKFCRNITPGVKNDVFCPDPSATAPNDAITKAPQAVFPNQLNSALVRGRKLYLPNIGAQPEPPVKFNLNVQALVHVADTAALAELANLHVNLNAEVKNETVPAIPTESLNRLFGNDIVAIDGNNDGTVFLIVSRGGNFVFRATADSSGKLTLGTPVVRFQTGNLPDGVVINQKGTFAYVNNEVSFSITSIDLTRNMVMARDIPVSRPPEPGTFEHAVLAGKLAFFTALGTPDNGLLGIPLRNIVPLAFRGKASDNAWSSCASCHPDGLSDNVTWIFATGPRQTIPLDAFFSKDNPADQRISNWSAVMGSITDFNNNSRNVQGGKGFAGDPPNPNIYNHGITQGASDALDLMSLWVQTVRTPLQPQQGVPSAGRNIFQTACASCHGGPKWSKSQVLYADNPAFTADPAAGGVPRDPGVSTPGGGQIKSYSAGNFSLQFLNGVGTFDAANPLEIRGAGAAIGKASLGAAGFNSPSLLGVATSAPYFHDGSAATLDEVFDHHLLPLGNMSASIGSILSADDRAALQDFLLSLDGTSGTFVSDSDIFRDSLAGGP